MTIFGKRTYIGPILVIALVCGSSQWAFSEDLRINRVHRKSIKNSLPDVSGLSNQCALDICGSPAQFDLETRVASDKASEPTAAIRAQLEDAWRETFDAKNKMQQARSDAFKTILAGLDGFHLTDLQQKFLNFSYIMNVLELAAATEPDVNSLINSTGAEIRLNRDLFHKHNSLYPAELETWIEDNIDLYFKSYYYGKSNDVSGIRYDTFASAYSPEDLKSFAGSILFLRDSFEYEIGKLAMPELNDGSTQKVADGVALNEIEKLRFMSVLAETYRIGYILNDAEASRLILEKRITPAQLASYLHLEAIYQRRSLELSNQNLQAQRAHEFIDKCYRDSRLNIIAAPSASEIQHFSALKDLLFQKAELTLGQLYSDPAVVARMQGNLNSVTFSLPPGPDKIIDQILSISSSVTQAYQYETGKISQIKPGQSDLNALEVFFGLIQNYPIDSDQSYSEELKAMCEGFRPNTPVDEAGSKQHFLTVGWQTVIFSNAGEGVVAHEIGHLVSPRAENLWSNLLQKKSEQCALNWHRLLNEAPSIYPFQYMEEDWADQYASFLLRKLHPKPPISNYLCPYLTVSSDKNSYQNLQLSNPSLKDTHSSIFHRLLKIQSDLRNPFSPACYALIQQQTSGRSLPYCSLETKVRGH